MGSGLVTSPCDQLRIFSGEARLIRIASKSAIGFARSNGLERNKGSSTSCSQGSGQLPVADCQFLVSLWPRAQARETVSKILFGREVACNVSTCSPLICVHHNPAAAGFRSTLERGHALGISITTSITARRPCTHCRFLVPCF